MLEDVVRKGRLLDLYGPLLTKKQRRCVELYFEMDLSLSEIGEDLDISRQGVYDMLNRASKSLESYEERLQLLARSDALHETIDAAVALLETGRGDDVSKAKKLLTDMDI